MATGQRNVNTMLDDSTSATYGQAYNQSAAVNPQQGAQTLAIPVAPTSQYKIMLGLLQTTGPGDDRNLVDTSGLPGTARSLAVGTTSANVQLSATCKRCSISASTADIRYAVGTVSSVAATASSHLIRMNERLDIDVPPGGYIAAIKAGATAGTLEITELA